MKQMKQQATLKSTIGLSQEETAMLLGVTRGQCSMFVSGKRDLPLDAKNKLIALLQHLKTEKPFSEERQQLEKVEAEKMQRKLEQDYLTIQIKQHRVAKKISIIENTRAECFAAIEVASFLENQKDKHPITGLSQSIRARAANTLKQHDLYTLTELQLKQENLEAAKSKLERLFLHSSK